MKKINKNLEKVARRFSELMIQRIKGVEKDWSQPWILVRRKIFFRRTLQGVNTVMYE